MFEKPPQIETPENEESRTEDKETQEEGFNFEEHQKFVDENTEKITKESRLSKIWDKGVDFVYKAGIGAGFFLTLQEIYKYMSSGDVNELNLMIGIGGGIASASGLWARRQEHKKEGK